MSTTKKKQLRRKEKKLERIRKEEEYKKKAWKGGKLIEENHNQFPYSPEFTLALAERLRGILERGWNGAGEDPKRFLVYYHQFSRKILNLILYWSPEISREPNGYYFFKRSLELYWDTPNELYSKLYTND